MSQIEQMILFSLIFLTVTGSVHYYIWMRAIRDAALPSFWRKTATVALVLLWMSLPLAMFLRQTLTFDISRIITLVPFTWLGIMMLLFFAFLFVDAIKGGLFLARKVGLHRPPAIDHSRRKLFGQMIAGATVLTVTGMATAGVAKAARQATVKRKNIIMGRLPKKLSGLKIVQISDLHIGITVGAKWLDELVDRVNALKPDIIAITGDLVDAEYDHVKGEIEPLRRLSATYGTYFVTGNHEYYNGVTHWIAAVEKCGIRVLRNQAVPIGDTDNPLFIAGVDDYSAARMMPGHGQDVTRAMQNVQERSPVVLLAHQPKAVFDAEKHGVDLVLSGHTHGGQIWPFSLFVGLQQPYNKGWYRHSDTTQIYVNQGTFLWGPPMRLGTECEITELTLKTES